MKTIPKLIQRFVGILLLSFLLLLFLNFLLLSICVKGQASNLSPWQTAQEVAQALQQDHTGYHLPQDLAQELQLHQVWAILIDNTTLQVIWHTDPLPEGVPLSYSIADIASLTQGYVHDYPTFPGRAGDNLVVLGYPQDSFWKHMWPSWDYDFIAHLPRNLLLVLALNLILVCLIYVTANSRLLRSIKPIVCGIQALSTKEAVYIRETGLLSELSLAINRASEILQSQERQLRKRDTARANWIAGVSHDIRTPLSMVMGYAAQLRDDAQLPSQVCQKAAVIVSQSQRMGNLIQDLNLASRLEYNMQPIHPQPENLVAIARQVVVDFMNLDPEGRHPIVWETEETLAFCPVHVDRNLISRAVSNLIQNCIRHNEKGCTIHVQVTSKDQDCLVEVADDGTGATEEQIMRLNSAPHYMSCQENTTLQQHGLGLLIVKQVIAAHGGSTQIGRSVYGGMSVRLTLPRR